MPRGDRTGPVGAGPMTGRGAGWCAGNERPGYANPASRLGLGLGRRHGGGGGRGRRNMYYTTGFPGWARPSVAPPVPAAEQELADLRAQASRLVENLDAIQKRIDEIAGRGAARAES